MFINENSTRETLLAAIATEPELLQIFEKYGILPEMQTREYLYEIVYAWIMGGNETHETCQ